MVKFLQARLQQFVNHELPDVQSGFRKGRGNRDRIANIHWIIEKTREFQKNIFCFIDYAKAFDCVDHNKLENSERDGNTRPPDLPPEKSVCRSSLMLKSSINICGGGPLAPEDSVRLNGENSFEWSLLEPGQIMLSFRMRLSKICSHILLPLVWKCMLFLFFEAATELGCRR